MDARRLQSSLPPASRLVQLMANVTTASGSRLGFPEQTSKGIIAEEDCLLLTLEGSVKEEGLLNLEIALRTSLITQLDGIEYDIQHLTVKILQTRELVSGFRYEADIIKREVLYTLSLHICVRFQFDFLFLIRGFLVAGHALQRSTMR